MELKKTVEIFFENNKKQINIKQLPNKLSLNKNEYEQLENVMYELELEGKLLGNDKGDYIQVPEEFYLYHGKIQISTKKNYYINMEKGKIIIIPQESLKGAKKGDTVFVETKKNNKHDKQLTGHVVRIVSKPMIEKENFLCKCNIKKDYNKGNFYICFEDKKITIPNNYLNGAYVNDFVTVQVILKENQPHGKVIDILKRYQKEHIFQYKQVDGILSWVPYNMPYFTVHMIANHHEKFAQGDIVIAKVLNNNDCVYVKKIETKNYLENTITSLCYDYGFVQEFSKKVYDELLNFEDGIDESEITKRKDLRNLTTITIDGASAKDLDDAISIEKVDDKYLLYIHIADVSHYVKPGLQLFEEAYQRGTSVYISDFVISMLPTKLSKGLCSLNPNEDKLTKTCSILIDSNGKILEYNIYRSVIKSDMKMSYEKVNDLLEGRNVNNDSQYIPFFKVLREMSVVANILQKRRLERGFISFQSKELEFDIDDGAVTDIHQRCKGPAQQIIENFMLLANEVIANYAYYLQVPFAYRNHEGPNIDQLNKLRSYLKNAGHIINRIADTENPKLLQAIFLTMSEGRTDSEMAYLSDIILKCMNRAYYSNVNIGHYGLALEQYATFTSPIRRFPDLLNHLVLDCIIDGDMKQLETYDHEFSEFCVHSTEKQLQAERLERVANGYLLKDYLKNYIGKSLPAKIIFIANDVIGVELFNSIYGNIQIHKKNVIQNKLVMNQKIYQQGDTIFVKIEKIKEDREEIILSIVKQEDEKSKIYTLKER